MVLNEVASAVYLDFLNYSTYFNVFSGVDRIQEEDLYVWNMHIIVEETRKFQWLTAKLGRAASAK